MFSAKVIFEFLLQKTLEKCKELSTFKVRKTPILIRLNSGMSILISQQQSLSLMIISSYPNPTSFLTPFKDYI